MMNTCARGHKHNGCRMSAIRTESVINTCARRHKLIECRMSAVRIESIMSAGWVVAKD